MSRRHGPHRSRQHQSLGSGLQARLFHSQAPPRPQPLPVMTHGVPLGVAGPHHAHVTRSFDSSLLSWSSDGELIQGFPAGGGILFPTQLTVPQPRRETPASTPNQNNKPGQSQGGDRQSATGVASRALSTGSTSTNDERSSDLQTTVVCRVCEGSIITDELESHTKRCQAIFDLNKEFSTVLEEISETVKELEELPRSHAVVQKLNLLLEVGLAASKTALTREVSAHLSEVLEKKLDPELHSRAGKRPTLLEKTAIGLGENLQQLIQEKIQLITEGTASDPVNPGKATDAQGTSTAEQTELHNVTVKDFDVLKPIEKGAFGAVFLVQKRATQDIYALKRMNKRLLEEGATHKRVERILTELVIMSSSAVASPFLVKLYYAFQTKSNLYLVMEYVDGGDLLGYLQQSPDGVIEEGQAVTIFAELVLAIAHLHRNGIVHRDIKPANVLLTSSGHVKLTDFGLSRYLEDPTGKAPVIESKNEVAEAIPRPPPFSAQHGNTFSMVGTPEYIAPEVLTGEGYDYSVDWWALGVLLYECLVGFPPFYHEDSGVLLSHIASNQMLEPTALASGVVSKDAKDLIEKLMTRDPQRRPTVEDIMQHPWFTFVDWEQLRNLVDTASSPYLWERSQATQELVQKYTNKRNARQGGVSLEDLDRVARQPGDKSDPNYCPGDRDCENCEVKVCHDKMPGFSFTSVNRLKALNEHIKSTTMDSATMGRSGSYGEVELRASPGTQRRNQQAAQGAATSSKKPFVPTMPNMSGLAGTVAAPGDGSSNAPPSFHPDKSSPGHTSRASHLALLAKSRQSSRGQLPQPTSLRPRPAQTQRGSELGPVNPHFGQSGLRKDRPKLAEFLSDSSFESLVYSPSSSTATVKSDRVITQTTAGSPPSNSRLHGSMNDVDARLNSSSTSRGKNTDSSTGGSRNHRDTGDGSPARSTQSATSNGTDGTREEFVSAADFTVDPRQPSEEFFATGETPWLDGVLAEGENSIQ